MSWLDRDGTSRDWALRDWPTNAALTDWLGSGAVSGDSKELFTDIVEEATTNIQTRIYTGRLPADETQCPAPIFRAIVLEAARLHARKQSVNGLVSFGDFSARLASVDVDIEALIANWLPVLMA